MITLLTISRPAQCICSIMAAALAGCGSAADRGNLPPTYSVSGVVTYDGQPLSDAILQFQLLDGSRGAVGKTDEDGRYRLTTFQSDDGALPGRYKVAITKVSSPPPDFPVRQNEDDMNVLEFQPENLLPEKYASTETSGLTAMVEEQANQIDFSLTK